MLNVFVQKPQGLTRIAQSADDSFPPDAVWFDLLEPTPEEEKAVERALSIDVPTREEMREIESSNRLYEENGVLYMTATIVTKLDTDLPQSTQVTFILAGHALVTNRYTDPLPFRRSRRAFPPAKSKSLKCSGTRARTATRWSRSCRPG